ncbi:MAG TPA: hypothetical protein QF564_14195 [Pirellulaceae bacterium]|jgi:hypothetical protein|nr:hypothetical protein [Pirellulaceae bacterium]
MGNQLLDIPGIKRRDVRLDRHLDFRGIVISLGDGNQAGRHEAGDNKRENHKSVENLVFL